VIDGVEIIIDAIVETSKSFILIVVIVVVAYFNLKHGEC
jgi:hypothetical protein